VNKLNKDKISFILLISKLLEFISGTFNSFEVESF
jgi:hypothetical protein